MKNFTMKDLIGPVPSTDLIDEVLNYLDPDYDLTSSKVKEIDRDIAISNLEKIKEIDSELRSQLQSLINENKELSHKATLYDLSKSF